MLGRVPDLQTVASFQAESRGLPLRLLLGQAEAKPDLARG